MPASSLHTLRARGLAATGDTALAALREPPPPETAMEVVASTADFATRTRPALARGAMTGWQALERWRSADALVEHYGDLVFSSAFADDVSMSLREYVSYAQSDSADSPYYLVERRFDGERAVLLDDFVVPPFADENVLELVPGYDVARYWFVGPARSGTFLHVDPLGTSAWNACVCGTKRWCLLPPETDLAWHGLEGFAHGQHGTHTAWFLDVLESGLAYTLPSQIGSEPVSIRTVLNPGELEFKT